MYIFHSWFTYRSAVDAHLTDILLIQRLKEYDEKQLSNKGLKMRYSWYLSEERATLALFSDLVSDKQKSKLVLNLKKVRNLISHLSETLPLKLDHLSTSKSFFFLKKLNIKIVFSVYQLNVGLKRHPIKKVQYSLKT